LIQDSKGVYQAKKAIKIYARSLPIWAWLLKEDGTTRVPAYWKMAHCVPAL
jgi:hypothetical protein